MSIVRATSPVVKEFRVGIQSLVDREDARVPDADDVEESGKLGAILRDAFMEDMHYDAHGTR